MLLLQQGWRFFHLHAKEQAWEDGIDEMLPEGSYRLLAFLRGLLKTVWSVIAITWLILLWDVFAAFHMKIVGSTQKLLTKTSGHITPVSIILFQVSKEK